MLSSIDLFHQHRPKGGNVRPEAGMFHCNITPSPREYIPLSHGSAARSPIGSSKLLVHIGQDEFIGKIYVTVFESEFLILSKIPLISEGAEEPEHKICLNKRSRMVRKRI